MDLSATLTALDALPATLEALNQNLNQRRHAFLAHLEAFEKDTEYMGLKAKQALERRATLLEADASADTKELEKDIRLFHAQVKYTDILLDGSTYQEIAQTTDKEDLMELLLTKDTVDPAANDSEIIFTAIQGKREEIVEMLLKDGRSDPRKQYDRIGRLDFLSNKIAVMLLMDGRIDPTLNMGWGLKLAIQNGLIEKVKSLLEDPRFAYVVGPCNSIGFFTYVIALACDYSHIEIVKLLIEYTIKWSIIVDFDHCIRDAKMNSGREDFNRDIIKLLTEYKEALGQ